jgi:hypothetical protein
MNYELVVFVIFYQICCILKFDMFTDHILDFDRYRCISTPNFRFRCFRNTDIVSVSGVTIFDFVSDKKYENGNGFSVYRPFSTVFIPTVGCPVCHPCVLCSSARVGAYLMRCSRPLRAK